MQRQVEFDEQKNMPRRRWKQKQPVMVRWMMKLPFIKTPRQANLGLLLIMISALLASYLILNNTFHFTGGGAETTYVEDLTPEQREELPEEFLEALPSREDSE